MQMPLTLGSVAGGKSEYAYLIPWNELNAPKLLYSMLDDNIARACSLTSVYIDYWWSSKRISLWCIDDTTLRDNR